MKFLSVKEIAEAVCGEIFNGSENEIVENGIVEEKPAKTEKKAKAVKEEEKAEETAEKPAKKAAKTSTAKKAKK